MIIRQDKFIDDLSKYSRQNLFPIQVAGLSVLTRLCNAPPPPVEYVLCEEEMHFKQILASYLHNEYNIIESPPLNGIIQCNLFHCPCYLFPAKFYNQSVISQIELIRADVRTREVEHPEFYDNLIQKKIIPLDHDLNDDLSYFWRTMNLIAYLPGFHIEPFPTDISKEILCGTICSSPLFRFPNEVPNGKMTLTYGARLIREFLLQCLYNVNFPADIILDQLFDQILNVDFLPWFDKSQLSQSMTFYENLEANLEKTIDGFEAPHLASVRLAIMAMPLYLYSKSNNEVVSKFLSSQSFTREFSDMSKLTCHKVNYDRCPLIAYLFIGRMGLPSNIVFTCSHICEAYSEIDGDYKSIDEWVFISAKDYWKEAIVLCPPDKCAPLYDEIIQSNVTQLLRDERLRISNNELQKLFSICAIDRSNKEMKSELYQFLKSNPRATIKDFRNTIRQKSKVYFQMQAQEKASEKDP